MGSVDALTVFVVALLTALATGLGALPLLLARDAGDGALGLANGVASGVMAGASVSLVLEGTELSRARTALGVVFVAAVLAFLHAPHRAHGFG